MTRRLDGAFVNIILVAAERDHFLSFPPEANNTYREWLSDSWRRACHAADLPCVTVAWQDRPVRLWAEPPPGRRLSVKGLRQAEAMLRGAQSVFRKKHGLSVEPGLVWAGVGKRDAEALARALYDLLCDPDHTEPSPDQQPHQEGG
jgi:hypothetical protein